MENSKITDDKLVFLSEQGVPVTTSLILAEVFGRQHESIIRTIKRTLGRCSADWICQHIIEHVETRKLPQGGSYKKKYYTITYSGFPLLYFRMSTDKFIQKVLKFIIAFNKMESKIN
jgi:Rha family phage regulatory protein